MLKQLATYVFGIGDQSIGACQRGGQLTAEPGDTFGRMVLRVANERQVMNGRDERALVAFQDEVGFVVDMSAQAPGIELEQAIAQQFPRM